MPETLPINIYLVAAAFALYSLMIVGVGLYASRYARQGNEDYFLAGRTLGPWVAALSASASAESGWVTAGLVGIAYVHGMQAYWIIPGGLIGFAFNWLFMARRMGDQARTLNAVTLSDYFAYSFRERMPIVRILTVAIIASSMMAYVAGQLAAAGKAFEATFNVEYFWGVLIGASIVLGYTVLGGFRAVCWTDYLQAVFMVATLFLFPLYMMFKFGGYSFITDQLATVVDPQHTKQAGDLVRWLPQVTGLGLLGFLFGSHALGINFGYPGQPHIVVRFMAMRDPREAVRAGVISLVWTGMVFWGAITTGLIIRAVSASGAEWAQAASVGAEGEAGLVVAGLHLLPALLGGMVLAAVLSAICSTADSQLIVAASAVSADLMGEVFKQREARLQSRVNRLVVLALGIGAVLLVIDQRVNVYKYVLTYAWAMLGASFGPQLILLLYWRRASYAGCIAGMAAGFATVIAWPMLYNAGPTGPEVYNLTLGFFVALIVNVVVSLLAPSKPRRLEA